jgi:hypothetical protein
VSNGTFLHNHFLLELDDRLLVSIKHHTQGKRIAPWEQPGHFHRGGDPSPDASDHIQKHIDTAHENSFFESDAFLWRLDTNALVIKNLLYLTVIVV